MTKKLAAPDEWYIQKNINRGNKTVKLLELIDELTESQIKKLRFIWPHDLSKLNNKDYNDLKAIILRTIKSNRKNKCQNT